MTGAVEHECAIELARFQTGQPAPNLVTLLLRRIEELETDDEEELQELARLREIEERASVAYNYHALGYEMSAEANFNANRMIELMEHLGEVL